MLVHLTRHSQKKILEIAMIWSRDHHDPTWLQHLIGCAQKRFGIVEVFNHLSTNNEINWAHLVQQVVSRCLLVSEDEFNVSVVAPCNLDTSWREIGPIEIP